MDVTLATAGLILLSPVIALVAIAIRLSMGSPVLFRQLRPGHQGRPFQLLKFRSMTPEAGPDGRYLPEQERVTTLGAILRRYSLDELLELWNVLKGDMSLVGPRPLLMEYMPRYTAEQARRHEVKPGITGLAQVRGRHELPWDERFRLDVWYVDHWSLRGDLEILVATARVMLKGDGRAAAPEFEGVTATSHDTETRGPSPVGSVGAASSRHRDPRRLARRDMTDVPDRSVETNGADSHRARPAGTEATRGPSGASAQCPPGPPHLDNGHAT